ncbi:MAG: hypothetical protein JWM57_1411 [Phycisphaerales bacterium]|nr:hypothetical protein [Phycisphaerales bacterium]
MELEEPTSQFKPTIDKRLPTPVPPPVRLLAIADMHLAAVAGLEKQLDEFYVGQLKFERDTEDKAHIAYGAEKFRLVFDVIELPSTRQDYRPVMVQISHFPDFIAGLHERQIEFEWQKGVAPGTETAFLQDPAGFWVSVGPIRTIA